MDAGEEVLAVRGGAEGGSGNDRWGGGDAVVADNEGEVAEGGEGAGLGVEGEEGLGGGGGDEGAGEEDGVFEAVDSDEAAVGEGADDEELEGVGAHVDGREEFLGIYGIVRDFDRHFFSEEDGGDWSCYWWLWWWSWWWTGPDRARFFFLCYFRLVFRRAR